MESCAEKLGAKIREIRRMKNETQQQLASAIGVVQQSVAAWESGRCMPNIESLTKMAEHYNVSTDWLLGLSTQIELSKERDK